MFPLCVNLRSSAAAAAGRRRRDNSHRVCGRDTAGATGALQLETGGSSVMTGLAICKCRFDVPAAAEILRREKMDRGGVRTQRTCEDVDT